MDGRRKPMQPMAGRLEADHRRVRQFTTSSTWRVDPGRSRLARRALSVRGRPGPGGRSRRDQIRHRPR
ncbi:transposase [Streptomyces sp. NPDC057557]|uniref:transposase n=1 Tax=Streptomyces sp. NPDC057557 TaxID=3346167 RepID=UPI0036C61EC0